MIIVYTYNRVGQSQSRCRNLAICGEVYFEDFLLGNLTKNKITSLQIYDHTFGCHLYFYYTGTFSLWCNEVHFHDK